jgi:hypothetical protein
MQPSRICSVFCKLQWGKMRRKLSDIFIEIALQGLKSPKFGNSEVMHALMMLAHIAWQRETSDPNFMDGQYEKEFEIFNFSKKILKAELVTTDWCEILQRMQEYKRLRFPDDNRIVTSCGFTTRGTLRVEWK